MLTMTLVGTLMVAVNLIVTMTLVGTLKVAVTLKATLMGTSDGDGEADCDFWYWWQHWWGLWCLGLRCWYQKEPEKIWSKNKITQIIKSYYTQVSKSSFCIFALLFEIVKNCAVFFSRQKYESKNEINHKRLFVLNL